MCGAAANCGPAAAEPLRRCLHAATTNEERNRFAEALALLRTPAATAAFVDWLQAHPDASVKQRKPKLILGVFREPEEDRVGAIAREYLEAAAELDLARLEAPVAELRKLESRREAERRGGADEVPSLLSDPPWKASRKRARQPLEVPVQAGPLGARAASILRSS